MYSGVAYSMEELVHEKRKVLIVGLGKTGLSCARYLDSQNIEIAITDSRKHPPEVDVLLKELPDTALFLGGFDEKVFESAEELIVSPGISLNEPVIAKAIERGAPVAGDIELFAKATTAPVIAITGSNGKSTVTSLVGLMAREDRKEVRVGGNLGVPALDLIQEQEPDLYVLELSSFQLESTRSLNASVAAVLNVSPDHMDRYNSIDEYVSAKHRVFNGDGVMVLNADDERVMAMQRPEREIIYFGVENHNRAQDQDGFIADEYDGQIWLCRGKERLIRQSELRIVGKHNLSNALAALAIGEAAGFSRESMVRALRIFSGLPHRTQWVAEQDNIRWYNDSKATNVGATIAALQGMDGKVVLIAGGDSKGADFSPMVEAVKANARAVILIGQAAPGLRGVLVGAAQLIDAENMTDAVEKARENAKDGDCVLLSPACASFDMYKNYEQRGDVFMDAVRSLLS